ncbi:hypothetical protein, partial [Paraburkholderia sp. BR14320]|uniref:hypothetical protein n=1 Tax=unclassified Paraburkholderia TaxID=2615204 RepID=UPI0034CD9AD3
VRVPGFFSADCVKVVPIRLEMMGITLMSPSATVYNGRHEPLTLEMPPPSLIITAESTLEQ